MNLGADRKKLMILGGLVVVGGLVYWMNSPDAPATSTVARTAADPNAALFAAGAETKGKQRRNPEGVAVIGGFEYKLTPVTDPSKVDPTLRLDYLTKIQSFETEGGNRNIFKIEQPPPEPPPTHIAKDKIPNAGRIPVGPGQTPVEQTSTIKQPENPGPPPPPPPTPINLKYYGYSTKRSDGERKAFFLDGEDVIVAAEGEIIKKQYRVVRIGVSSVQMEDTRSKSTQTLPLQQDAAPGLPG